MDRLPDASTPQVRVRDQQVAALAGGLESEGTRGWISSPAAIAAAGLTVFLAAILTSRLERFPEWDEAVFLSQSGGLNGIQSPSSVLVASREVGPPYLIEIIRTLVESLANTRLLWIAIAISLLTLGSIALSRHIDVPASLLTLLLGTYWLSILFMSSFYGYFIAGAGAMIVSGCYLSLRQNATRQAAWGVGLGLSLALTLWFRQIEGALIVMCLLGHAAVVTPGAFLRQRLRGIGAALGTFVALFVIPWIVDTTIRYDSVANRISAGSGQNYERGFFNHISEYVGVLVGRSVHYAGFGDPSLLASLMIAIVLLALLFVGGFGLLRRRPITQLSDDGVATCSVPLVLITGTLLVAFFVFFIGTVRDRYLIMGGFLLASVLLSGVLRLLGPLKLRSRSLVALVAVFTLWVTANVVVAGTYEAGRFRGGMEVQHYSQSLHRLASGRDCQGFSRHGAPQIQFGSGCLTRIVTSAEDAAAAALEATEPDRVVFVWWPRADAGSLHLDHWNQIPPDAAEDARVVVFWSDGS